MQKEPSKDKVDAFSLEKLKTFESVNNSQITGVRNSMETKPKESEKSANKKEEENFETLRKS